MAQLVPVEGDPFAAAAPPPKAAGPKLTPVEGDPFKAGAPPPAPTEKSLGDANLFLSKARKAMMEATGHELGVDYFTGIDFIDRSVWNKLDNDKERELYLNKRFGKEEWGRDPGGRYWIKQGGGKTAVESESPTWKGAMAALYSLTPEMIGGGLGAAVGGAAGSVVPGPGTALGAMAGAGVGTALGKGADEIMKALFGWFAKTPGEEFKTLRNEALLGAAGEGVGRAITGLFGRLTKGPIPRFIGGQTPESNEMTALTLRGGAVPPAKSALPHMKVAAWHQMLSEKVVGPFDSMEQRNAQFIENEIRQALRTGGIPEAQVDAVLQEVTNPTTRVSTTEAGKQIQASAQAYVGALEQTVTSETAKASGVIDKQLKHLETLTQQHAPGDLGVDVAKGLQEARDDFGKMASKVYARVDDLLGGKPVVPMTILRRDALAIVKKLPKSDTPTIFHEIAKLPDRISLADAQRLRTRLRESADSGNLLPGTINHDYATLAQTIDRAIGQTPASLGNDPTATAAIRMLRAADKFYGENVKKFGDAAVTQLVRQAKSGMTPDPGKVAAAIIRPGQTGKAVQILKMLPPQVRQRVMAADYQNMIGDATMEIGGRKTVSAKGLLTEIERRGKAFDELYGPRRAAEIRKLAQQLAARDGDISAQLVGGDLGKALVDASIAQGKLDAFMGDKFLAGLANPNKMPEDILRWIVRPGKESAVEKAVAHFGEGSPQVAAIRQMALRDLLRRAVDGTQTGIGKQVAGGGIEKALASFTERQQELLFPNGLADDIRLLAKEAKFLYPQIHDESMSGFAAGAILATPIPFRWIAQAYAGTWGFVLSRPGVIRALALGLRGDGPVRFATQEAFRMLMRGEALSMAPDVGGDQPQP